MEQTKEQKLITERNHTVAAVDHLPLMVVRQIATSAFVLVYQQLMDDPYHLTDVLSSRILLLATGNDGYGLRCDNGNGQCTVADSSGIALLSDLHNKEKAQQNMQLIAERDQKLAAIDKLPDSVVRDMAILGVAFVYELLIDDHNPVLHIIALRIMQLADREYGQGVVAFFENGEPAMMDASAAGLLSDLRNKGKAA